MKSTETVCLMLLFPPIGFDQDEHNSFTATIEYHNTYHEYVKLLNTQSPD